MALLVLLLALALPAIASSQAEESGDQESSIPGPEAFAALDVGQSPEPVSSEADRDESATAHTDLSSGEALALLGQEFEEALVAQPIPELDLSGGRSVERYLDTNSALIDVPESAADLMVEGTSPLRAPENGAPAPLDGELVVEGDHFEASNAPVEAELPAELPDGVAFDQAGVEVVPVTSEPVGAVPVDDKLFYPNFSDAAADTDVLITPTSNGADVSFQLRSQESPERLALEFSMPEGATLETTADGVAAVGAADGTGLVTIAPAFAWDAEGTPVPVRYGVVDDRLELSVPHQGRDLLYPLIVDPLVEHDLLDAASGRDPLWNWYSSQPGFTWSHEPDGLQNAARPGTYPNAYDNAQFVLSALRDSTIEQITYQSFFRYQGAPPACTLIGLWSRVTNWWEPGTVVDAWGNQVGAPGSAAQEICGSADYDWRDVWVGPNRAVGDTPASNRNMAVFSLFVPPCCTGGRLVTAYNRLNEVWVYRHDYEAPSASFQSKPPSGWRDDGNETQNLTAFGVDEGLGIKRFELLGPGINPLTGGNVVTAAHPCTGQRGSRCPGYEGWAREIAFKLRQGRSDLTLESYDVIGRRGRQGLDQRIDRTPPLVQTPSGSLYSNRADIRPNQSYELNLSATDGSLASDSQMRSGVVKLEVFVDDEPAPRFAATQTCTGPNGSCPMPLPGQEVTWEIPPGEFSGGSHEIKVVATDQLGHRSNPQSQVFTIQAAPDLQDPAVSVTLGPTAADGTTPMQINATDGGAGQSGLGDLEVSVDGNVVQEFHQDCPNGGCPMSRAMTLTQGQNPATHQIDVFGDDQYGNSGNAETGREAGYMLVGYNEIFHTDDGTRIREAIQGGATVLRSGISWCEVQPRQDGGFNWQIYDGMFNEIARQGGGNVKVLAVLSDFPAWAKEGGTPDDVGCAAAPQPPGGPNANYGAWRNFVREFVAHYGASSLAGIEAWNEPNLAKSWGGGTQANFDARPHEFARLVREAALGITDAGGGVKLFPGGLSPKAKPSDDAGIERFLMDATDPAFDFRIRREDIYGFGIHLYHRLTNNDGSNREDDGRASVTDRQVRRDIRAKYQQFVDGLSGQARADLRAAPRWITEIGFPSESDQLEGTSSINQRKRLLRSYRLYAPRNEAFVAHRLRDGPSEHPFGVLTSSGALKAGTNGAYCRLAVKRGAQPPQCPP